MKNFFLFIGILFLMLIPAQSENKNQFPAREFRAAWIATVWNLNWPSEQGLSSFQQKEELIRILDIATSVNLNAIIFQVRPGADAFYKSKTEPWSEWLTGKQGQAPEPIYDPLEFIIREAHARGLELHAWINPYRAGVRLHTYRSEKHISNRRPDWVHEYGNKLWLDPGNPEVIEYTLDVIMDIVRRYDIDGIHFDDYFYPYPIQDIPFPDAKTYAQYTIGGGKLSLEDWRRDNINNLVKRLHDAIQKEKPWVKFGISPFGIWQPGYPEGIAGFNPYVSLHADSRKWLREGWLDYFAPQLYWRIDAERQSYPKLLEWWMSENIHNIHIYPGNNISRVGAGTNPWEATEIKEQINITRNLNAHGNIHFSMKYLVNNSGGLRDLLTETVYSNPALIPTMEWKESNPPAAPLSLVAARLGKDEIALRWKPAKDPSIWRWAIYRKSNDSDWELIQILPADKHSHIDRENLTGQIQYAVTALDRLWNESIPKTDILP